MTSTLRTRLILPTLSVISALALSNCASGPTYAETKDSLPPIAKGHGRVFVYRPGSFGMGIRPTVKIDDQVVGRSEAQGFFYTDQKAGARQISISTEWKHKNTVNVTAGKTSFVECTITPGVFAGHVLPNQVQPAYAESRISGCKLSEKP